MSATYHSVLPPAAELERYEALLPGTTERFLRKFEQQVDHRMTLEKSVIDAGNRRAAMGLRFGFTLSIFVFALGGWLVANGKDVAGLGTMGADVAVLVGSFLYGDIQNRRERRRKAEQ